MNRWLVNRIVESPNWNERKLPVSMVVLHYTGMKSAEEALQRMCDPAAEVSAHYLIDEEGIVTSLVPEEKRAWHAGQSYWRGITDVNSASVGIELANPGHEFGYRPFPEPQMDALLPLLADIMDRHDIPRANVVAHSDIAPARKQDPGEYFDWHRLGELGLALDIPAAKMNLFYDNPGAFYLALERFGYDIADGRAAVRAFQRRWRPMFIDGEIDGEIGGILFELLLERDTGRAR
ncbi:N-acetylmuramoyl-L-alanine amidase [Novosphingobium album (ex Hu et al. 2023)]|uniref:N-acetylmuramoyl-L-alanine amidase n=1 Tax=Novosphingobium album (ex Hu et al. 2023) TaxID=2930093 RepID=A0ABT0AWY5_9SPHN|nr:N-acetylmuramoyl-L-alanine amidase [Novosphingobium album (ex Hu et al. 2023)]MCJ2177275.1 N-acetylmuramoyl-L-alanine amidase [Novosphingobium album (ex Hu et al. 2023)]